MSDDYSTDTTVDTSSDTNFDTSVDTNVDSLDLGDGDEIKADDGSEELLDSADDLSGDDGDKKDLLNDTSGTDDDSINDDSQSETSNKTEDGDEIKDEDELEELPDSIEDNDVNDGDNSQSDKRSFTSNYSWDRQYLDQETADRYTEQVDRMHPLSDGRARPNYGIDNRYSMNNQEDKKKSQKNFGESFGESDNIEYNLNSSLPKEYYNKFGDYYSKHNYGPEDYGVYSQDPEWRRMMLENYPDTELPPLLVDNQFKNIADYYSAHNYGLEDHDIYSKDPEWQRLMSENFPNLQNSQNDFFSKEYNSIVHSLKDANVDNIPIRKYEYDRSSDEIVNQLGGGDLTQGSCSSLAFAYAGNKAGYFVLDFRDGNSREYFSQNDSIEAIANLPGVDSKIIYGKDDIHCANELINMMEPQKDYYLATGQHASIVRRSNNGCEYLELQTNNHNGWKPLNDFVLEHRFGCSTVNKKDYPNFLIDVKSLGSSKEFCDILGYINTEKETQKKGENGYEK